MSAYPRPANGTERSRRLRVASAACLLFLGAVRTTPAGATSDASAVVSQMTSAVIAILQDADLSRSQKRARIESIVYTNIDFRTMSRLVLARNWRRFSAEQQRQFIEEFKQHLANTYSNNIDDYRNERVAVVGEREEVRGDRTVQTKIVRGGAEDILVDYRLRRADDSWRIIDVIIERVSLVSNFRSQFQDMISQGGPEKLLQQLREKNQTG